MTNNHRRKRLLNLLAEHRELEFSDLVARLHSSKATVRRDVVWLAERGLLSRRRGVVMYLPQIGTERSCSTITIGDPLPSSVVQPLDIARHAASFCSEGETIILHGGRSSSLMSAFLPRRDMKILTNSIEAARHLLTYTDNDVLLTAGRLQRQQSTILSQDDEYAPAYFQASKIFVDATGISEQGLLEADSIVVRTQRRVMELADEIVVLAEGRNLRPLLGGQVICALAAVSRVVTDHDAPAQSISMLRAAGVTVDVVRPDFRSASHGLVQTTRCASKADYPVGGAPADRLAGEHAGPRLTSTL